MRGPLIVRISPDALPQPISNSGNNNSNNNNNNNSNNNNSASARPQPSRLERVWLVVRSFLPRCRWPSRWRAGEPIELKLFLRLSARLRAWPVGEWQHSQEIRAFGQRMAQT